MLWYLLYPLRGTAAPVLDPKHPFRRFCTRYATWTARHVAVILPLSGAVIFLFLYLFPFLYATDAPYGASNFPRNVWTDVHPMRGRADVDPDVVVHSAWIYGTYMKALDRDTLLAALDLQDMLLGPTAYFNPRQTQDYLPPFDASGNLDRRHRDSLHLANGLTDKSWFFHSPLQYWNGSADAIASDPNLIATVNAGRTQLTSVNTTLRHSLVFSGERFEDHRIVAADSLVITLVQRPNSPIGHQLVERAEALARDANASSKFNWQVIPPDGRPRGSQLYKIQYRPMSWFDAALLTLAYSLIILNMLLRLSKMHAVKSRFGLMVTILVQIGAAIISSFSVCAILGINLSRLPHYAYPLVVLAISMENSFRLINAVLMTSSAISNSARVGEAFGTTAHITVASYVQNSFLLFLLSRVTASGIRAFCTFAAIAIVFDFFYLSTFFLSVLSVDMRQRELWELERASLKRSKKQPVAETSIQSWVDGLFPTQVGEKATPTRIAGTIVVLCFVLIAQAHYTSDGGGGWLGQVLDLFRTSPNLPTSALLAAVNQARDAESWLEVQDHETAREVIQVIKPGAHTFVARIYEPLLFVWKGADRTPDLSGSSFFPPGVHAFLHQFPRFAAWLLIMLAILRQFTNYLIKDRAQDGDPSGPSDAPSLLSVRSLAKGHTLDVAMLTASPDGRLVSVGLDRAIQVWDVPSGARARVLSDPEVPLENPFPVLSMALDDRGAWLALITWQRVFFWSVERHEWAGTKDVDLGGHRPEAIFFVTNGPGAVPSLVLVRRNGVGLEIEIETERSRDFVICKTPLVWAVSFTDKYNPQHQGAVPAVLTLSRRGCIHLVRQRDNEWVSTEVQLSAERDARDAHSLIPIPGLSMYMIGRSRSVDLVDLDSSTIVHTFFTDPQKPRTLKHVCSARSQQPSLASLTLAYVSDETGDVVVHSCLPDLEDTAARFGTSQTTVNLGLVTNPWAHMKETIHRVSRPGVWEALPSGNLVGVRQKLVAATTIPSSISLGPQNLGMRKRIGRPNHAKPTSATPPTRHQGWEAWVLHLHGDDAEDGPRFETRPLDDDHHHLLISEPGPTARLGPTTIAVAMGDVVKVISVGGPVDGGGGLIPGDGAGMVVGGVGGPASTAAGVVVGSRRKRPGLVGVGRGRKGSI